MKVKFKGPRDEITFRGVTFKKGKAVDLSDNPSLAQKVSRLDYFEEAQTQKVKADADKG